ncbi:hypothetical protein B0H11DRAFT_1923008 [Mycena galericulata]|nr:hypothetical protein B0H11DRAFT_1923008 [Mycena galericulata]
MARGTKAQKARQNNLQKARNSLKVTVEEVPDEGNIPHQTSESENNSLHNDDCNDHFHSAADNDDSWDLDLSNKLPDVDCDDIPEGTQEPDLDEEIFFSNAQSAAQKAERVREAQQKRPKHCRGNAPRTKRHHKKMGKDLGKKGFLSVYDFIQATQKAAAAQLQNTDLVSSAGDGFSAAQSPAES